MNMIELVALIKEVSIGAAGQSTITNMPQMPIGNENLSALQRENGELKNKIQSLGTDLKAQTKRNGMLKSKLVDAEEKLAQCRKSVKDFEI